MAISLVSIIIPCFNQANYLDQALTSILKQDYEDWECLIIDDGSTDHTRESSYKWMKRDRRFKYYYQENKGLSSARNFGINLSKGSFIQFLDADDFLEKRKLSTSLKEFERKKIVEIVITNYRLFDEYSRNFRNPHFPIKKEYLNSEGVLFKWDKNFAIPIHCGIFCASLFNDFRFSEDLKSKEDWVMWVKFFKNQVKIEYIDEYLAFYRRHDSNMTNYRNMTSDILSALHCIKPNLSEKEYIKLLEIKLERSLEMNFSLRFQNRKIKQNLGFRIFNKIFKPIKA
ncbi:glycosyltransferase family 2 protein [Christiangramia salexigens]|uniref:Glycosyltransferase 2-like domain-containing protein n=1 Tax=Christiangramia salexigens TaxID=1913577 RepID=A0A1L3J4R2_9FLAO|nr:glycosyltransferase [Christiangramia salexigens]APG60111.1 hypothetical protein LPB144_06635 [Christiangramia salexigens]